MLAAALTLVLLQTATEPGDDLSARLKAAFEAHAGTEFRGAALVLSAGKPLLAAARGQAHGEEPITTRTYFDVGSIAKSFTAAAVLVLAEQRKLALGDSIAEHLAGVPADKRAITVRELLEHSSGLPRDVRSGTTRDETVAAILAAPAGAAPGSKLVYSNGNYTLLAALVERVAGMPFERFVHERVFAPAGLADTLFVQEKGFDPARDSDRLVLRAGKPVEAGTATYYAWGWGFKGSTGVVTTLEDLGRWCRALAAGEVLGKEQLAELWRPGPGGYACGWFVRELAPELRQLEHSGSTPGYRSALEFYPERDLVIAVAGDESCVPDKLLEALRAEILGGKRPERVSLDELELWANARASLMSRTGAELRTAGCPDWSVKTPSKDELTWCYVNPPLEDPDSWLFGLYLRPVAAQITLAELERALAEVQGDPPAKNLHELVLSVDDDEIQSSGWVSFLEKGLTPVCTATAEGPERGLVLLRLQRTDGTFPATFRMAPAVAARFARALRAAMEH